MTAPDVVKLVEDVRQEIDRRRSHGELTDKDIQTVFAERLWTHVAEARIDPKIGALLMRESHDWNIDTDYVIQSDRSGIAAPLIRFAKRLVRPFVRLYTDHVFNRQAQLNLIVWRALVDSVKRTVLLEQEVKKLRHEMDVLKHNR